MENHICVHGFYERWRRHNGLRNDADDHSEQWTLLLLYHPFLFAEIDGNWNEMRIVFDNSLAIDFDTFTKAFDTLASTDLLLLS